jgi:UDP-glucose-4-epimerase GalE
LEFIGNKINGKKVLVTGGAGYIGSHACKALSKAGYLPIAFDNLIYGHRDSVKWGPFEEGDITDSKRLDCLIEKYQPEAVLHFAGFAYVGESMLMPEKYFRNNVVGSLTLLESMIKHRIRKIVFSSTCSTYGDPLSLPISEEHIQNPVNPYGQTKLIIEKMLNDFDVAHGIKSISLRYFNAAGADPDGEIGEDHTPETHLVPLVLDAALGIRPQITIHGSDYATPDGTCIRDYIHVTDLAWAHVLALKKLEACSESAAYNLGNGIGYSVKEVIDVVGQITGKKIPSQIGPRRPGDPDRLISEPRKAMNELGWKPQHGDIKVIIDHAWKWHMARTRK